MTARPDAASGAGAAVWRVRLHFEGVPEGGRALAYKFKIERPGRPDDGWEPRRNRSLALVPGAQTLARAYGSEAAAPPPQRTGHIERVAPQPSAIVSPREVQVWLRQRFASTTSATALPLRSVVAHRAHRAFGVALEHGAHDTLVLEAGPGPQLRPCLSTALCGSAAARCSCRSTKAAVCSARQEPALGRP